MSRVNTSQGKAAAGQSKIFLYRWYCFSAGMILALTGAAKIGSALGNSKSLAVLDPIIGVTFAKLMLTVGAVEILIAFVCFARKWETFALWLIALISTNFLVYRICLFWIDWHGPCSCLGNLTAALHISSHLADNIMKVFLFYLLIGSYGLLIWHRRGISFSLEKQERDLILKSSREA